MAEYRDSVITKLIEALEAAGPEELVGRYRYGDVLLPPKEELPICAVIKDNTVVSPASNMEDEHQMQLVLNILYDWSRDLSQSFDLTAGSNSLYDYIEGRDDSYQLKEKTLLRVLRSKVKLDNNLFLALGQNQRVEIDYGMGIEKRGSGIFSIEAMVRFTARLHIAKPS